MSSATTYYRLGLALALATVLFLVWAIGALGVIGDGSRHDRMYLAVSAILVLGSAMARFRAHGMALVLVTAAVTHAVIGVIAIAAGLQGVEGASVPEILGLNAMYAALFGASAWLFWRAAAAPDRTVSA